MDCSDSPWDSNLRRPGHADERRAWHSGMPDAEIVTIMRAGLSEAEIQAAADRLLALAA